MPLSIFRLSMTYQHCTPFLLSGPLPTIIAPHGGPHTAVTAGWFMPYAYLATLGFAVICPNYRWGGWRKDRIMRGTGMEPRPTRPSPPHTGATNECAEAQIAPCTP